MAEQTTIRKCLTMLNAAYPGTKLEDATPQLYYRMLEDIPDDTLEIATLDHISKSPYYPRVSELRRASANITTGAGMLPDAMDEWGNVLRCIKSGDEPTNPITRQVIEALDMYTLRQSDNQAADRARFIEAYHEKKTGLVTQAMTLPSVKAMASKALPAPEQKQDKYQEHQKLRAALGLKEGEPL